MPSASTPPEATATRTQVGNVQEPWGGPNPGDFDCYKRAENIPAEPNCPLSARVTFIADVASPHADGAGEASSALAAAAALLQGDYPMFADFALRSAKALFDFASRCAPFALASACAFKCVRFGLCTARRQGALGLCLP